MNTAAGNTTSVDTGRDFTVPKDLVLRRVSGYIELGELSVEDGEASPAGRTLLQRALTELLQLPEGERSEPLPSLLEGEALRALGQWEAAIPALGRATGGGRGRLEAWLGLGWCWKRLDRLDAAIDALRGGLAAFPDEPVLLYNLACYHSLAGDVPAAVEHLTKAIAIDPRFRDLTGLEHDFDPIRSDPRFVAATSVSV